MLLLLSAWLVCLGAYGAPGDTATLDRSTWPEQLTSPALFDVASRAEILTFAHVLLVSETLDEPALAAQLGLKQVNLASVERVREGFWQRLLQGYNQAQQSCEQDASFCYYVEDLQTLREAAGKFRVGEDSFYARWAEPARVFHQRYLNEQLRLAALFPQTSSEVALFGEQELNGEGFNDRLFLLSFDKGPSPAQGNTDAMAEYLRKQKMNGLFFVLGNALQARIDKTSVLAARALYSQQCVGVAGWEYRSHSVWQQWQDSVQRSVNLAHSASSDSYEPLFRPPYGQRRADAGEYLQGLGLRTTLWDIDAGDDGKLSADASAQRVLTLMLLWRRGIIAFHDSQDKALAAVPWLLNQTAQSGIGWQDCREVLR